MSTASTSPTTANKPAGLALAVAALATLLASTCCVLPLALVILGVSGAWISRMHVLEPYSPALIALALAALGLAAWRLFRPAAGASCEMDASCRVVQSSARRWFWVVAVLALIPIVVPLLAPLFY